MIRLRYPFAGAFAALLIICAYAGLTPHTSSNNNNNNNNNAPSNIPLPNDKILHFAAFFLLTLTLYWSIDLPRRPLVKIILSASLFLSLASEIVQALLPNDRTFDPIDVAFNVAGSAAALALCNWYHKRMAERRRVRKYGAVPGDELRADDVELAGIGGVEGHGQELGVVEEEEEEDWDELDGGGGTRSGNAGTGNEAGVTV